MKLKDSLLSRGIPEPLLREAIAHVLSKDPEMPSLILNFNKQWYYALGGEDIQLANFSDLMQFSRVGGGGRFTSEGRFEWIASSNTPRFSYDPVTLAAKGLLIEQQTTNISAYSEDLSGWARSQTTVVPNIATAPDGSLSMDRLLSNTVATQHYADRTHATNETGVFQLQVFFEQKSVGDTLYFGYVVLAGAAEVSYLAVTFTSEGISVSTTSTGLWIAGSILAEKLANGLYRVTAKYEIPSTMTVTSHRLRITPRSSASVSEATDVSAVYWGLSCTQSSVNSAYRSYIPTPSSAAVVRSSDFASLLLLDWFNPLMGTLVIDHDVPNNLPILSSGPSDLLDSAGAGRSILAWDQTNIYRSNLGSAYTTAQNPGIETSIKLLRNGAGSRWANSHIEKIIAFPRKLTVAEAMAA